MTKRNDCAPLHEYICCNRIGDGVHKVFYYIISSHPHFTYYLIKQNRIRNAANENVRPLETAIYLEKIRVCAKAELARQSKNLCDYARAVRPSGLGFPLIISLYVYILRWCAHTTVPPKKNLQSCQKQQPHATSHHIYKYAVHAQQRLKCALFCIVSFARSCTPRPTYYVHEIYLLLCDQPKLTVNNKKYI